MAETIDGYAVPIHRTEVDGIPCFWADLPEEFEARLSFRVGAYDETLATRGATHLIEHLAISDTSFVPWDYSAWVSGLFTTFSIVGTPDDVVDGLAGVAARLRELPLGRLPVTRRALLTESSRTSSASRCLRARYGARGPGLAGYPEYGVRRFSDGHVVSWTQERFTNGNAVLVLTGPPPPGLTCVLEAGERLPPVPLEPRPGDLPRLVDARDETWAVSYLAPPSVAESAGSDLFRLRVVDALHYRLGISDGISRSAESLTPTLDHRYVRGDLAEGYDDGVVELVLGELRAFADEGPTGHELAMGRAWADRYARSLDHGRDWLDDLAGTELLGAEPLLADWGEAYRALDEADVAEAMATALPTLIVESNTHIDAEDLGLGTTPGWADDPIDGTAFRLMPFLGRSGERFVVGDDAVSWVDGDDVWTIRVEDLAVMLKDDASRELIDVHSGEIRFEADDWSDGRRAFALIDTLIPEELTVDLDVDGPEVPHFFLD
jgi:hypothetical protein